MKQDWRKYYRPSRPASSNRIPQRELRRVRTTGIWGKPDAELVGHVAPFDADLAAIIASWKAARRA